LQEGGKKKQLITKERRKITVGAKDILDNLKKG